MVYGGEGRGERQWKGGRSGGRPLAAAAWFASACQPFLERTLALGRRLSGQQVGDADVLVERRPVNALAAADEPPRISLRGRAVYQARVPAEWNSNGPAVGQFDGQGVLAHRHSCGGGVPALNQRRTHS